MKALKNLIQGQSFSESEALKLFESLAFLHQAEQAAIIALLSARGETVEELFGALEYTLAQSQLITPLYDVVDIVGTGGDGLKTFNISTAASLVVAAAGVKVAKHGGRAVSSASGSTDVIEALRLPLLHNAETVLNSLAVHSFAYLFAPHFNPLLKTFATLRKILQIPTMLNVLGPLSNPIRPKRQVIGVFRDDLLPKIAQILLRQGTHHAMIVKSVDGLDELSLSDKTLIFEVKAGQMRSFELHPHDVGLKCAPLETILGGSPLDNAQIIERIFNNKEQGPKLEIVLLNAAAGLVVAGKVSTFEEGVALARSTIASLKAKALLQKLQGAHS